MKSLLGASSLLIVLLTSARDTSVLGQEVAPQASVPKVQAILEVDLGGDTGLPFLDKSLSSVQLQTFINNQVALIKSQFVIKAALARPDIARLTLVQSQRNKDGWLFKSLDVHNPARTSLLVLTLESQGDVDELEAVLDSVVNAYQTEVVAADRIATSERHRAAEVHTKMQEADFRQLLERRQALANELKGQAEDSAELRLLDLKIGVRQKVVEEIERALVLQEMRNALGDLEVKVLQQATVVPTP